MKDPRTILITGASSGIGEALALAYAQPGRRLVLGGRSRERLELVAAACRARGADVVTTVVDIIDRGSLERWLVDMDRAAPLDLVIANAGVSGGTLARPGARSELESAAQARAILAVNLDGVIATVMAVLPAMIGRRRGQIAIMSSLASFRGFPGAPAYCASKAAVRVWGEALRPDCRRHGVAINVICPGYIKTPMTAANDFPMPFLMDAERAARIIVDGLARDRARIVFPWRLYAMMKFLTALPEPLIDRIMSRLPRKKSIDAR
jgi:short-subunit dehydrogenase